jgi:hypothetical protein
MPSSTIRCGVHRPPRCGFIDGSSGSICSHNASLITFRSVMRQHHHGSPEDPDDTP